MTINVDEIRTNLRHSGQKEAENDFEQRVEEEIVKQFQAKLFQASKGAPTLQAGINWELVFLGNVHPVMATDDFSVRAQWRLIRRIATA